MTNVGYATLPIIPSFQALGPQLATQISTPMKTAGAAGGVAAGKEAGKGLTRGLGAAARSGMGLVAGGLIAGAVGAFFGESMAGLKRVETVNAQTANVIRSTGGAANVTASQVEGLAGKLENLTGTEAETIQEGANFLLTFKNIKNELGAGNDIFDQTTQAMVDMSRATGQDMQSASLQLGKALNDPIAGVSALARVGVGFTDQQKEQIRTLQESGDLLGAQKIILAEVQSQFGGSGAAYAETYAGKLELINHAMGNMGEQAFSALMPALTWFADVGITAFRWLAENPIVTTVILAIAAAMAVITIAQWAWNAALLANPITWIILAIVALVAVIVFIATQTTWFQDIWAGAMAVIGAVATWLWENVLNPVFTAVGAIWNWLYTYVIQPVVLGIMLYIGLWAAIITWLWNTVLAPVFGFIGQIFTWIWQSIIMPIVNFIVAYFQALGAVAGWLWTNAINPALQAIGNAFSWLWNNVIRPVGDFIGGAIRTVGDTIRSVFGGIADFMGSAFQAALSVVRGPINGIIDLVNGAISGINSIRVTIPDWVPVVGGQTFGVNIPRIPRLATGADVLARPGGTLAILAEAGQAETVTNLGDTNRHIRASTELAEAALRNGGNTNVRVFIGDKELTDFVRVVVEERDDDEGGRAGRGDRPDF